MSTKKNDTDDTIRTSTTEAVNLSDGAVVNEKNTQHPQRPEDSLEQGATALIKPHFKKASEQKSQNASMEAFSGTEAGQEPPAGASAEELREAAVEEAKRYQDARERHEDNADRASWHLLRLMLRVLEAFEQPSGGYDAEGFQRFLKDNGAPPRDNAGSDFHRLAKACTPVGMKSPRVSKFGGTLKALSERGVRSDTVLAELNKRLPIKEDGPSHFGAHRFFLLYQQDKRAADEKAKADMEPVNPYSKWTRKKLIEQGKLLFDVIWKEGLLPSEFDGIEAALDAAAEAE